MTGRTFNRRLAAIIAADIVGYSRMMGADEEGTLERVQEIRRALIEPAISGNDGRLVKTTGDGFLIEFGSVVSAFRFSQDLHEGARTTARSAPAGHEIAFRVGLNVGDIIFEGDDVFGAGVNVAARLEQIAAPGTTCLSEKAWSELRHLKLEFQDLGVRKLKNIDEDVRVFQFGETSGDPLSGRAHGGQGRASTGVNRHVKLGAFIAAAAAVSAVAIYAWAPLDSNAGAEIQVTEFRARSSNLPPDAISSIADEVENVLRIDSELEQFLQRSDRNPVTLNVSGSARKVGEEIHYSVALSEAEASTQPVLIPLVAPANEINLAPQQVSVSARALLRCATRFLAQGVALSKEARQAGYRFCAGSLDPKSSTTNDFHNARLLTEQAPNLAEAWSTRALIAAGLYVSSKQQQFAKEYQQASEKALKLNPANSEALLAQANATYNSDNQDFNPHREGLLRIAARKSLTSCYCELTVLGDELLGSGRITDAVRNYERAYSQLSLDPNAGDNLAWALFLEGKSRESYNLLSTLRKVWPSDHNILHTALIVAIEIGDTGGAEKLIQLHSAMPEHPTNAKETEALKLIIETQKGNKNSQQKAVALFSELSRDPSTNGALVITALRRLGQPDLAAEAAVKRALDGSTAILFWKDLPQARRHPKALEVYSRYKLAELWKTTEVGPDFCKTELTTRPCELLTDA